MFANESNMFKIVAIRLKEFPGRMIMRKACLIAPDN
jgi:hypothetical protein